MTRLDRVFSVVVMTSRSVNVYEAKTSLSKLLDRAAAGEEIVIARAGRPVARLVPLARHAERRQPGAWRGRVRIARDFDELPSEIAAAFLGDGS